jgi:hypothetical protein
VYSSNEWEEETNKEIAKKLKSFVREEQANKIVEEEEEEKERERGKEGEG